MDLLDKTKCEIKECRFSDIRHLMEVFHYKKGNMGGGISTCFAMYLDGNMVGGSVMGLPRHQKKYPKAIDIRRMVCTDASPKNSESYFIGQIRKWIRNNTDYENILSYSDPTVGHFGTIYKASGFYNAGNTNSSKYVVWRDKTYHPRSLSIDRPYSYKLREAVKTGEAIVKTGLPKIIWILPVNRRTYKKSTK